MLDLTAFDVTSLNVITDVTPAKIIHMSNLTVNAIDKLRSVLIFQVDQHTIDYIGDTLILVSNFMGLSNFLQNVHPSDDLKPILNKHMVLVDAGITSIVEDNRFYEVLRELKDTQQLEGENLRLINCLLQDMKKDGVHLPKEQSELLSQIRSKLSKNENQFNRNITRDTSFMFATKDDLDGVPPHILSMLEMDEQTGQYKVTMDYHIYYEILKYAKSREFRQRIETFFNSRFVPDNLSNLAKMIKLRRMKAQVLGYKNYVDHVTDGLMGQSYDSVMDMLKQIHQQVKPYCTKEDELMAKVSGINDVCTWDISYIQRIVRQQILGIDESELLAYFPTNYVLNQMFEIFREMFRIKFVDVSTTYAGVKYVPEIMVYQVEDELFQNRIIGYMILDLFPRKDPTHSPKYKHAACFSIRGASTLGKTQQIPITGLVTSFTPANDALGQPSLLNIKELTTLFHELGHGIHNILGRARHEMFAGTNLRQKDMVELQSQILEELLGIPRFLRRLTRHYKTGEQLTEQVAAKVASSMRLFQANQISRQMVFSLFDTLIHGDNDVNDLCYDKLCKNDPMFMSKLYQMAHRVLHDTVKISPQNSLPANFTHLGGGYDGRYYTYVISKVGAIDIYRELFSPNKYTPQNALRYRQIMLQSGGKVDVDKMMHELLGRPMSMTAIGEYLNDSMSVYAGL